MQMEVTHLYEGYVRYILFITSVIEFGYSKIGGREEM